MKTTVLKPAAVVCSGKGLDADDVEALERRLSRQAWALALEVERQITRMKRTQTYERR